MSRFRSNALALTLLLALLLPAAVPAVAFQGGAGAVTVTVTPALEGNAKYGEWMALRVKLANDGADVNDAEVQAQVAGNNGQAVYTLPVPLPAGARKEVTLYITPPSFGQAVDVQVVSGAQRLAVASMPVTLHPQADFLIGVAAPNPSSLALLNALTLGTRDQVHMIPLTLEGLPERFEALRSLDALILSDVDTTVLTPAQSQALQAWVESGGRLFLGGGAGAARVLSGLPAALQIVQPGQPEELDALDALASWAGEPVRVPGPFLATFPSSHNGRPAAVQDGKPFLVRSSLGSGRIFYLALDPAGSPFDAWAGAVPFWQKVFEPGSALPSAAPTDIPLRMLESQQISDALYNLPGMDPPSITWLAILLGTYVVLVGPVNYLVLRRRRRFAWAWLTVPLLTVAFAAGGFFLGFQMRGSDVTLHQISVLEVPGGGRPIVRSYAGIFSPTRASYDMQIDGDVLLSPMLDRYMGWDSTTSVSLAMQLLQGIPARVRGLDINQWAMRSFEVETTPDPSLGLDTEFTIEGRQVQGMVRNRLGQPLQDVIFVSGHLFARLGDLAVGEEKRFDVTLIDGGSGFPMSLFEQQMNPQTGGLDRNSMLRSQILDSYLQTSRGLPQGLVLIGWSDWAPVSVQVDGVRTSRSQTTLVANRLTLPIGQDGQVNLPPGYLSPQLTSTEGDAGICGPSSFFVGNGQATLEYELPAEMQGLRVENLSVSVSSPYGPADQLPDLALYDWTIQDWITLHGVAMAVPFDIADAGRFIDPEGGTIRLQVHADTMQGYCLEFDLGIQGTLPEEGGQ